MKRREFLSMTVGALALAVVPASVKAEDFRKSKPAVWSAKTVDDAIKALYGTNELTMSNVKLITAKVPSDSPKKAVASNGGAIPVDFSVSVPAKTVSVYQDSNPEAAVCVIDVTKYDTMNYSIKIKMAKSGTITVVAEGTDGKLYAAKQTLDVALGGCEG
ncbi:MAG: thiosulfate oxidation carrier protein SoxY [Epsilonproteobacteria bacterium]|nr:thiosulfate oxidation carrier protein SoxY [Campylobacterota bacterium]